MIIIIITDCICGSFCNGGVKWLMKTIVVTDMSVRVHCFTSVNKGEFLSNTRCLETPVIFHIRNVLSACEKREGGGFI